MKVKYFLRFVWYKDNVASKNSIKEYLENGYYHVYNRGTNKQPIFLDYQDYFVFLNFLEEYLLPKDKVALYGRLSEASINYKERDKIIKLLNLANYNQLISLLAYCLMPNHIHFLIKQTLIDSMPKFMNSILLRYSIYFNKKYRRSGSLFQGVYKAVRVESDEQLLYLTSYIHRNPAPNLFQQPSSYPEFLGQRKTEWVKSDEILDYFSTTNQLLSYQSFAENTDEDLILSRVGDLILE